MQAVVIPQTVQCALSVLQSTHHVYFWWPWCFSFSSQNLSRSWPPFKADLEVFPASALSAFSPAFLNFCSQIIGTVSRVIGLVWVGFLSAALLWQFWRECSPVHIYRLPSARPERPWKACSSFCLSLVTRMCGCHGAAPDSGPFLPVSLRTQSCCWACSLRPACPGWSWTIWCSLFQTTVLSLLFRLMRIFQCTLISALPSHLAHTVSSVLFDT